MPTCTASWGLSPIFSTQIADRLDGDGVCAASPTAELLVHDAGSKHDSSCWCLDCAVSGSGARDSIDCPSYLLR